MNNNPRDKNAMKTSVRGFTLIELMMVVAISGVLLTLGLPSFSEMITANRITSQANSLVNALNTARAEAIRRGAPVCVKRISTTANEWSAGWKVFVDGTTTRTFSTESNRCSSEGVLIQTFEALAGGNTLKASADVDPAVRFNAMGVAVNKGDTGVSGSFDLCRKDGNASKSKKIAISITGMISMSSTTPTCP